MSKKEDNKSQSLASQQQAPGTMPAPVAERRESEAETTVKGILPVPSVATEAPEVKRASADSQAHQKVEALTPLEMHQRKVESQLRGICGVLTVIAVVLACFHPTVMETFRNALQIMPLLLLVLIFFYVVNPLVQFVTNQVARFAKGKDFSYKRSLAVIYIFFLLLILGIIATAIPFLLYELDALAQSLPEYANYVQEAVPAYWSDLVEHMPPLLQKYMPSNVESALGKVVGQAGNYSGDFLADGLEYLKSVSSTIIFIVTACFMVPFIGYYCLADGKKFYKAAMRFVPRAQRPGTDKVLRKIHHAMQSFMKGQLLLCLAVGGVTTLVLAFIMPNYCLGLGLIAGVTEAIPIVGPILGAVPAVIVAWAMPTGGLKLAVIVALAYTAIQQLEGNLLVPNIMGNALGVHPLSLIIGMILFGNIFGFWGIVLASPITAIIKIIVWHLTDEVEEVS